MDSILLNMFLAGCEEGGKRLAPKKNLETTPASMRAVLDRAQNHIEKTKYFGVLSQKLFHEVLNVNLLHINRWDLSVATLS